MTFYTIVNVLAVCAVLFLVLQLVQWVYGRVYRLALQREREGLYRLMMGEAPQIKSTTPLRGGRGSPEWHKRRQVMRRLEHEEFERSWELAKDPFIERKIQRERRERMHKQTLELMELHRQSGEESRYHAAGLLMQLHVQERLYSRGDEKTHWNPDGTNDDWMR